MNRFYEHLQNLLKQNKNFIDDNGNILRNVVIQAAKTFDAELLKLLLSDEKVRAEFFVDVDGVKVFNQNKFSWTINNHEFLPDSYTSFKNKIGLVDERGNFISNSSNVELVFPYKDCVLEGGQTKDDQKRAEIFYNETLARDEIDTLLAPKVFTNAKKFSADGVESCVKISPTDNLIIKGNNLIALACLQKRFANKIKCIYIDVPYNTGNDSFGYNDRFNHSTWLTFMKNRLEFAKKLLTNDGVIFIHCDNNEQAYLKVLCDEIFGRNNFVETITVVNNPAGRDYGGIANMHEFIHVYLKQICDDALYNIVDENKKFPYQDKLGGFEIRELRNRNTTFNIGNRPNLCYPFYVNPDKNVDNDFLELSLEPKEGFIEVMPAKSMGVQTVWRWGKEKSAKNLNVNVVGKRMQEDGRFMIVEKYREKSKMARSVWYDKDVSSQKGTIHLRELFGKKIFNFPKPEELLSRILQIGTKENDIVLDFFLGSGTTAAVAHKMKRQYIGVEQMDYIETVTVERLKKVIDGEQGGISKSVEWQGGGSFIYCELAKLNQNFVDEIAAAQDIETLHAIFKTMCETGFINYKLNIEDKFAALNTLETFDMFIVEGRQKFLKKFLMELLDKNMLYVNYSDIDDADYKICDADKKFTRSFYVG